MSKFLVFSLLIITLIIGVGVGYILTPGYQTASTMEQGLGTADKYLDLRYINQMIAHHKGAINLGTQLKANTKRSDTWNLANDILESEPKAIKELEDYKKAWYNDTSDVKAEEVPNLGTSDANFDLRFLNALIAHHEAGVLMAKEVMTKSTRNEILNNADAVNTFLNKGIKTLKDWRLNWYNI